jgi:Xaa-Pro aminopeptidase
LHEEGERLFATEIYSQRRNRLASDMGTGVILFLGNTQSPINFLDNVYPFRQDSSFLYFWGLENPDLTAVIDVDAPSETIFGNDMTLEESVWAGPQPSLASLCEKAGIQAAEPADQLEVVLSNALKSGRPVHFLPQFRGDNILRLARLLNMSPEAVGAGASPEMIRAVVFQRSIKTDVEIDQIEKAVDLSHRIQLLAMKMTAPGMVEREVVGAMESLAYAAGGRRMAFPTIFSIRGDVLHNPYHQNTLQAGDLVINDSGVESPLNYASDITRTFPVGGTFDTRQKEIYQIVLASQEAAIQAIRPGIEFRNIHILACRMLTAGLKQIGLMTGDVEESLSAGAHALFMPAGLGHMMGLDVHDMEDLGEDHVGYTDTIRRSTQFGANKLRLARKLERGFVLTVEPGIYFIPQLMEQWKASGRFDAFIDFEKAETYMGFGGVRIEDDVLVTGAGCRVLGKPIPKSIEDVEAFSSL